MTASAIIPGSLGAIAQDANTGIAEAFVGADSIIIVDTSGSMETIDSPTSYERDEVWGQRPSGPTRYERACEELAKLQATLPGKIAVIAFSSTVVFCPGGKPFFLRGGTDLAKALKFVRVADGCDMQFVVISDGEPNSQEAALDEAKRFTSTISTVFVGKPGGSGEAFLRRLAAASGGKSMEAHEVKQLAANVQKLLAGAA